MTINLKEFKIIIENRGLNLDNLIKRLEHFKIATPSWAYTSGGTRFYTFKHKESATSFFEKIKYAGIVNKFTGITPELAIHIPWDKVDDIDKSRELLDENNLKICAINPNLFQDDDYKFGSITNPKKEIRNKAIEHLYECIEIGKFYKAPYQSYWFADGTNYPGQGDFIQRKYWILESLKEAYQKLESYMTILIEYKFYEPAFYHTDIPDWGTALLYCQKLGEKAKVLVDLGHHAQATNIEFIVANLVDENRLGGFHLNSRKYGDDDLTTGSLNLYELFLIFHELIKLGADDYRRTAFMLDQSHNLKPPLEAMIQSVISAQEIYAKALTINLEELKKAQEKGDIVKAEELLKKAFFTDVKPLLSYYRELHEIPIDPLKSYQNSDIKRKISQGTFFKNK
ncbi:MAG: TIM barrel protein [Promethearchaeota archaeon]